MRKKDRTKQEVMEEFAVKFLLERIVYVCTKIAGRYAAPEMRAIAQSFVNAVHAIQEARQAKSNWTLFVGRQLELPDYSTTDEEYGREA